MRRNDRFIQWGQALWGYVTTAAGESLVFSLMLNGIRIPKRTAENRGPRCHRNSAGGFHGPGRKGGKMSPDNLICFLIPSGRVSACQDCRFLNRGADLDSAGPSMENGCASYAKEAGVHPALCRRCPEWWNQLASWRCRAKDTGEGDKDLRTSPWRRVPSKSKTGTTSVLSNPVLVSKQATSWESSLWDRV